MSQNATLLSAFKNEGFHLQHDWLNACVRHLNSNSRNLIFDQLLCTDIVDWGTSVIPNNFNTMHQREWSGAYVLQINEIINLCVAKFEDKNRDPSINPKLLRLKLTDGHLDIYAMVYQHIDAVDLNLSLGSKIAIRDAYVRRGYLILTNSNAILLHGFGGDDADKQELRDDNKVADNPSNHDANHRSDINENTNRNRNRNMNNNINHNEINVNANRDMNHNEINNRMPRKLTQKEKLCGFGAQKPESAFLAPTIVQKEKEKLEQNEINANISWTCATCTFDNMNRANGVCEICGMNRNEIQQEKEAEDDDIEIIPNNVQNNTDDKNKTEVDSFDKLWEDITCDDDDIDMNNMNFSQSILSTNSNINNRNASGANKSRKKKKKFF